MSTKSERCSVTLSLASLIYKSLGKVGSSLGADLESGRHGRLVDVSVNPKGYSDFRSFYRDYQASCLLRKFPKLSLNVDRRGVAIKGFVDSEVNCREINRLFSSPVTSLGSECYTLLGKARRYIRGVLGDFSWDAAIGFCDFGPGASIGVPRRRSHQCEKIGNLNPTATGPCMELVETYLRYDPHVREVGQSFTISRGSHVTTVPKDARKDRIIAIEPLWNTFFQKGIGGLLRSRLRAAGLDLDKAHIVNGRLARNGSLDDSLATIDLSSASDSISYSLVEFLLPESWFRAMQTVRSNNTLLDSGWLFLQKFSSMGNGFTFELESLIFLALCKAVAPYLEIGRDVSVYGDDIILPSTKTGALVDLLANVGFKTNHSKTFLSGPFRESCGQHYFHGRDVTPFFLKKELGGTLDWFYASNSVRLLAHRFGGLDYGCHASFRAAWDFCLSQVPKRYRSYSVPVGFGDCGIVRDFDEVSPRPLVSKRGFEGFISRSLTSRTKENAFDELPALISKLWFTRRGLPLGDQSQYSLSKPLKLHSFRTRNALYPQWLGYGPWVEFSSP
jgi:hypothetical protein